MFKNSGSFKSILLAIVSISILSSCKNTFDLSPEGAVEQKQAFKNVYDADAAVYGIYGQFSGLAERYIVLNELRGDLLDVTPKANNYLKQISTNTVTSDNPYADPRPFYKVIVNCNDAIENFKTMHRQLLLTDEEFYQRYTELIFLRSWLYLQLGIHWGSVPYITQPLEDVSDIRDQSKFQKIPFGSLLDSLISVTEAVPEQYLNQNTSASSPTLLVPTSGYVLKDGVSKFFIHRRSFLGDLHLWKGNYLKAATYYKNVMETGSRLSTSADFQIDMYDTYKVSDDKTTDRNLYVDAIKIPWRAIFSNPLAQPEVNRERMWTLPLDASYGAGNPLVDIFSVYRKYLLKPSEAAINNWNSQDRDAGATDLRGLNSSYGVRNGQNEVLKYTANYDPITPFATTGIWILYRAEVMHLRYAEASNELMETKVAGALVNSGISKAFDGKPTGKPFPFDFDPTSTTSGIRAIWHRNIGVRGRATLKDVPFTDDIKANEDKIIEEAGLEAAFEGYRWGDLVRIALRRKDFSFLNEKLKAKTGNPSTIATGSDGNASNLYLPF